MKITTETRLIPHKEICKILGLETHTLHRKKDKLSQFWIQEETESNKKEGRIMWDSSRLSEISAILHKTNAA